MNVFSRIGNGLDAFKAGFNGDRLPYSRLIDGTHAYGYEASMLDRALGYLGIKTPHYTPVENYKYYYFNALFLADCIDIYVDNCTKVDIVEVDKNGNEVEDSEYIGFLRNPNPTQSLQELIAEMVINLLTTGISIQYGNFFKNGNLKVASQIYNLDFNRLSMPIIKDPYSFTSKSFKDILIKERLDGKDTRTYQLWELAYYYDRMPQNGYGETAFNPKNFFNPVSRITSLLSSLHTLINSQDSMSYLTSNPVNSVISPDPESQKVNGITKLPEDQKRDAELKLNGRGQYGAGSNKIGDYIVADQALRKLDLSRNNAKAQNIEMQQNAKDNVRTRYLIHKDHFGDATYENQQVTQAAFITGPAQSITDKWLNTLMLKSPDYFSSGNKLIGRYDHLPAVIAGKVSEENKSALDKANTTTTLIDAFERYRAVVDEKITWDQFLLDYQFNGFYKVKS